MLIEFSIIYSEYGGQAAISSKGWWAHVYARCINGAWISSCGVCEGGLSSGVWDTSGDGLAFFVFLDTSLSMIINNSTKCILFLSYFTTNISGVAGNIVTLDDFNWVCFAISIYSRGLCSHGSLNSEALSNELASGSGGWNCAGWEGRASVEWVFFTVTLDNNLLC